MHTAPDYPVDGRGWNVAPPISSPVPRRDKSGRLKARRVVLGTWPGIRVRASGCVGRGSHLAVPDCPSRRFWQSKTSGARPAARAGAWTGPHSDRDGRSRRWRAPSPVQRSRRTLRLVTAGVLMGDWAALAVCSDGIAVAGVSRLREASARECTPYGHAICEE